MVPFKLIMISAMYENGGNTTHRMLDGHPELWVYPFESQLGTSLVSDYWQSFVPFKYRWPEFPQAGDASHDYELIFDEEMKVRLRTPERSKFNHARLDMNEVERKQNFCQLLQNQGRSRPQILEAFFRSTFDSWKNVHKSGGEKAFLGYSPVLVLDTNKILADFPDAHVIHVIRNPYSGYADTKKRPFPLSLDRYTWTWNVCQHMALTYQDAYPKNFHILRFEDLVADPKAAMTRLCGQLGLCFSDTCLHPSWNGIKLEEVYPWGTIRIPTPAANLATMNELRDEEIIKIRSLSLVMQKQLGYEHFWTSSGRNIVGKSAALSRAAEEKRVESGGRGMARFLDLEDFHRQRKSVFYAKTDLPLPTSFLNAPVEVREKQLLPAREISEVCRLALGEEPLHVEPLDDPGTFHLLYRARMAHDRSVVVRVNALSHLQRDFLLFIDPWVMSTLRANSLPSLKVYKVDVTRDCCPFDYEILEEARGRSLRDYDAREDVFGPLLVDLGRFVARLHRIRTRGFGLLDVRPWVEGSPVLDRKLQLGIEDGTASGILRSWKDYIFLRLDDHVKKCLDIGAISSVQAAEITNLFESMEGSLADIHPVLLQGDLGNHNIFTDGQSVTAVIDWEDCLSGDPVFDIAFWATFHTEERHGLFLQGYRMENQLPEDFSRRFWLYYLRIALSKTVLRARFGLKDRPGRPPASRRIQQGLEALSRAA